MKTQNVSRAVWPGAPKVSRSKAEMSEPLDRVTLSSPASAPAKIKLKTHQRVCFKAALVLGVIAAGYAVLGIPALGEMLPQLSLLSGLSATAAHAVTAATPFALWSAGLGVVALSERRYGCSG